MNNNLAVIAAVSALLAACGGGGDNISPVAVSQLFAQTNDSTNAVVRLR